MILSQPYPCRRRSPNAHSGPYSSPAPLIAQHHSRSVIAARAKDTAAGMHARASHVQAAYRRAIRCQLRQRAKEKHLIERHFDMHYIAAQQPQPTLEIERRLNETVDDRAAHLWRITIQHLQNAVGGLLANVIPLHAVGDLIR